MGVDNPCNYFNWSFPVRSTNRHLDNFNEWGAFFSSLFSLVYSDSNSYLSPCGTKRDCARSISTHFRASPRNGEISWAKRKRNDYRRRVSEAQGRVNGKIVKKGGLLEHITENQVICDVL